MTAPYNLDHVLLSILRTLMTLFSTCLGTIMNVTMEKISLAEYVILHKHIFPDLQPPKCMINTPKVLAMHADEKSLKCQLSEKHKEKICRAEKSKRWLRKLKSSNSVKTRLIPSSEHPKPKQFLVSFYSSFFEILYSENKANFPSDKNSPLCILVSSNYEFFVVF